MALVRGKFVDKTEPIKSLQDPVAGEDLARKSYVDSVAAAEAAAAVAGKIEDAIVNGVVDKAPSQNAVFDALALKQASLGTGTTSQYLRGDLTWQTIDTADLVSRISAMEEYKQEHVHVDNVAGVDEVGRGSFMQPFKTINYAYSQVPSLGNPSNNAYNASVGQFVTEKLVIKLAPGRYTENVVLGFKRARVELVGDGATIVGDVKMSVKLADFPASNLDSLKASFPAPYTGSSAFMNFQLSGACGGGLEADPTANNLVVTGQAILAFEESTVPGSGVVFPNWDGSFGQFYTYLRQASVGNLVVTTSYTTDPTKALPSGVIEVDSCNIATTATAYRMFTGLVPYTYLTDFANWNVASKGTTNKAPAGTWTLKAHNSTFGNVIGPRLTIGEMDSCRIYDIDRTMRGTVDNGAISGSTSTSYVGFVNNQFRVYSGSGDLASAYKIGQASGTTRYKMDSVSYTTMAFSRNSSGVLTSRTLDVGAGVSYDFLDDARSVFVAAAATNYTRTAATVDSSLEGINTSLGTKQASLGTGTTSQYLRGDLTWQTISSSVADEINDGTTNIAPSQNAVFDALALKLSTSLKGANNGLAELDGSGKVPLSQIPASVGAVQSVNSKTGTVVLNTDDIAESGTPTNKWFTDARAKAAVVEDSITDGVTDKAPSQNAVYDALALKLNQSTKGAANGVAELDGSGKVPSSQLPAIAITDTSVVNSQAAMLALSAQKGDVAVRTDLNKSFILAGTDPTQLADWQELLTPTDAVISVNGQTGSVSLDSDDIAEGSTNKYFSAAAAKSAAVADSITNGVTDVAPSQNAVYDALALKSDVGHTHSASDITDFNSSAKSAAVVNSTAGTQTDQAASVAALKSYVSGQVSAIVMPVGKKERFVLSAGDITNGYVDCAFTAMADTMMVSTGGVLHNEGVGEDYTLSVVSGKTRITFEPDLAAMLVAGDDIYVQYLK